MTGNELVTATLRLPLTAVVRVFALCIPGRRQDTGTPADDGATPSGARSGQGRTTLADSGKMNGRGALTLPDGSKYVGEFKDDKRHGHGTCTSPDGTQYVGEFTRGVPNGQGTMTRKGGEKETVMFKDGKIADASPRAVLAKARRPPERGKL